MKKIILFFVLAGIVFGGWYVYTHIASPETVMSVSDPLNATYVIAGESFTLVDGLAEKEIAPGSASKKVVRYFGNELYKDLNDDGREDVVFLLTQETGGSGVFFYAVAALNMETGYVGSEGIFLGDRIAPQTTEPGTGKIVIINYADRAPGEAFAVQPSYAKSLYILLDPNTMQFGEVVQQFEGEADPSRMTLDMNVWTWIKTVYNNDTELVPRNPEAFTISFANGEFSATTDCNAMIGQYKVEGDTITFGDIASTKKFCEESQEQEFASMLRDTGSFFFTSKGELIFNLVFDGGSVLFR